MWYCLFSRNHLSEEEEMASTEHRILKVDGKFLLQYRRVRTFLFWDIPGPWYAYVDSMFEFEMPQDTVDNAIQKGRDFLQKGERIPILETVVVA
jgi:hypothetical protein